MNVYEEAANLIAEHGLWKSSDHYPVRLSTDDTCIYLAWLVAGNYPPENEIDNFISRWATVTGLSSCNGLVDVFDWNDAPERTAKEVEEVLREMGRLA